MGVLNNKIDFVAFIAVNNANPNGDPLDGNRPRTDYNGYGEISDVCIKRKLRNRLQDMGEKIFVQSDDRADDEAKSLKERAKSLEKIKDKDEFAVKACETWLDVRSFGQVFAFKGFNCASVGVRGPVSVHQAVSMDPVDIVSMQITKSVNGEPTKNGEKGSDTMGLKHMVKFGLYEVKGAINVQLAEKTGFTEDDAEKIKDALKTLFVNDSSSARPDGSMEVVKLFWFKHNCKDGQYSSAKVHRSVHAIKKEGITVPASADDYEITVEKLPGLEVEEIEGM
ncbi:MAG: type I-C CRISPR-associated protein Cas7/Csd2 [Eubacterium sp.]|jgi:CRISPR-associated protein Csd2|nr:type I-C CRISPR-associated protein Cas7/Csd2 [Eubacterium sp.]MCH4046382.1 type I-C CRISPR-associated protein Cas7/Csd2 [Eubacterium sp.]MCH4079477.1 type I-C CRISPR-associated protein Cas7/Csd2 [Eubacterium sp.]MCH4111105.1 type I-C CRISPR-associated protein Cas7/Csd2 [Eubacterium sp.]MCI1520906.1 type I-C CRISPR-associated protein Cas7/Csd2 [Eubacterium sp.]